MTSRLVPRRAEAVIGLMYAMEFPVSDSPEIYGRACELAVSSGAHVFDTLYHAVALCHPAACWSPRTSATIVGRPRGAGWYGFETFGSSRPA